MNGDPLALQKGLLEISGTSAAGSVSELLVVNYSQLDVIILNGEELVGVKQNQIVNTTIVVPASEAGSRHRKNIGEQHCWCYIPRAVPGRGVA